MEIQTWISDTTSPNKIICGFYFILVRQIKYCCHGKFLFLIGWIFKKFPNDLNYIQMLFVRIMVFNATFNNISVISWRPVLLMEKTGVPGEKHRPVASRWQTLSYNVASSTPHHVTCEILYFILVHPRNKLQVQ